MANIGSWKRSVYTELINNSSSSSSSDSSSNSSSRNSRLIRSGEKVSDTNETLTRRFRSDLAGICLAPSFFFEVKRQIGTGSRAQRQQRHQQQQQQQQQQQPLATRAVPSHERARRARFH
ncbi:hypothetical protein HZH68_008706 [Vespula germanica]|uniref:Uncharacterized protein n=1 Tax=Vespula germanica TaxID=30212 RepID=A0A834K2U5_VESGE|nr:hypothetical protein HZH68_008706 [Vespula germanica]